VQQHFGVGLGAEADAAQLEFATQLAEVVDLAVADNDQRFVLVADRLVAAAHIDDRQPPHADRAAPVAVHAVIVRAAVRDRVAHARQGARIGGAAVELVDAVDAAHRQACRAGAVAVRGWARTAAYTSA
jgi:hypothetical protein